MKTFLTIFFLGISICYSQTDKYKTVDTDFDRLIRNHFAKIDSLYASGNNDSLEAENNKIAATINKFKTYLINRTYSLHNDDLFFANSADRNLLLISWNTRMGRTMIAFTTVAVFRTQQNVRSEMLLEESEEMKYSYMRYYSIETIANSKGKKYIWPAA